ncbi:MAG: hypothetical protein KC431_31140, partial [Myxococcales bacterium]|nr:hypothetical protein [Myxococcales bacterium]
ADTGTATTTESGTESTQGSTSEESGLSDLPGQTESDCTLLEDLLSTLAGEPNPGVQQQLISEFIHAVTYGERGFPIAEGNKLAAVYWGDPGLDLALVGDFNGWEPSLDPMEEVVPGFYVRVTQLPAPASGLYKLVEGGTYFADPLARRFAWDEFGEYSQVDAIAGRSHYERWPDFDMSAGLLQPRTVTVYLPADAWQEQQPLPTLYMHDGQNLFAPDALWGGWQVGFTLDEAIGAAVLDPLLVVGVDNTSDRFDEYTQVGD